MVALQRTYINQTEGFNWVELMLGPKEMYELLEGFG